MTSKETVSFYDLVDSETARHILEGGRIVGHAVKLSVVCVGGRPHFAVDTLRRDGRSDKWERETMKICRIVKSEARRLSPGTLTALADIAAAMPGGQIPLFIVETHLSVPDGGGTRWEVVGYLSPAVLYLSDVVKAVERSKERVLEVVGKT